MRLNIDTPGKKKNINMGVAKIVAVTPSMLRKIPSGSSPKIIYIAEASAGALWS